MKIILFILGMVGCSPQTETACFYQCVDDGVQQSADSCDPVVKTNKWCVAPDKRKAILGEDVNVIGFDPNQSRNGKEVTLQVRAYVQEKMGTSFVLSEYGRFGLLGAGIWGMDGYLLGLVQEEYSNGLMLGVSVE